MAIQNWSILDLLSDHGFIQTFKEDGSFIGGLLTPVTPQAEGLSYNFWDKCYIKQPEVLATLVSRRSLLEGTVELCEL